jgi:zinc transporter ZupT
MKSILFSTGNVVSSLVLGALAFGFVFIKFPGAMEQILNVAAGFKLWLTSRGVSPEYNNWMRVLLEERQLVFMGFTIATRVLMASLGALVSWILNL